MTENKPVKTLNGRPTRVSQLSLPVIEDELTKQSGLLLKLKSGYKNLNLVLAGMYTGVTCYGVPHEEQTYKEQEVEEKFKDKLP